MLAIALGVYLLVFAVVVAVFFAASRSKPFSSTLDWDDDLPESVADDLDREPEAREQNVV